jgi:hypothetical protein
MLKIKVPDIFLGTVGFSPRTLGLSHECFSGAWANRAILMSEVENFD